VFDELGKMTVLDLVELKKKIEDEWGVTARRSGGCRGARRRPAAAGGDGCCRAARAVRVSTSSSRRRRQEDPGDQGPSARSRTSASRRRRILVDGAPSPVKEGVAREEAESLKSQLEEAGGAVEIK
jgi:large subunit ribosomal protein L7/L12